MLLISIDEGKIQNRLAMTTTRITATKTTTNTRKTKSLNQLFKKQGWIHGYPSRVRVGRGSDREGHWVILLKNAEKVNSRKSVRWSAVPVAPMLVYVNV